MGFPVSYFNASLDAHIGNTTSYDVALYTVEPNDEGVGGTEVTGGGYSRVAHASWNAAASGIKTNNGVIDFGDPTADWGTIVAIAIWDGATFKGVTTEFSTVVGSSVTNVAIEDGALQLRDQNV